ncbi:MAG TPA: tail fiber domain-containing protein [Methylophilaceae bacterium]
MHDPSIALMLSALLLLLLPQALQFASANEAEPGQAAPERKPWQELLMFKKGGKAPKPDPNIGKAALENAELGREWLSFAREQFDIANERQAELDELTKLIGQQQIEMSDRQMRWSEEDRQRYQDLFQPLEDRFVEEASTWDSPERQAQRAAEAKADVLQNAAAQRAASQRQAASMGVNPASGRFQGLDRASELQTALAAAGAQNQARDQVRKEGMAMRADAVNVGRGLPAQSAQAASLGLAAGNSALAGAQGAHGAFMGNTQIMGQGFQGAMYGNTSMANILNQQYQNQLQAWAANKQATASGIGGIAGAIGQGIGAYLGYSSSKAKKTDKKPVKGALQAIKGLPVESWKYKPEAQGKAPPGVIPPDDKRHIGPYAEDFKKQTGLGDGKTIPLQDAIGITMKAIQELDEKLERLERVAKK